MMQCNALFQCTAPEVTRSNAWSAILEVLLNAIAADAMQSYSSYCLDLETDIFQNGDRLTSVLHVYIINV